MALCHEKGPKSSLGQGQNKIYLCIETPCIDVLYTEATEAHFFSQESSSTHRIWVRFHRNWVGHTGFEFVSVRRTQFLGKWTQLLWKRTQILCVQLNSCGNELKSCASNSIPAKKVSLHGFRSCIKIVGEINGKTWKTLLPISCCFLIMFSVWQTASIVMREDHYLIYLWGNTTESCLQSFLYNLFTAIYIQF